MNCGMRNADCGLRTATVFLCVFASLRLCVADSKTINKVWQTKADWLRCTTDGNIDLNDDGTVRLKKSVLLQDEQGATHYNNAEALTATTWAKKRFVIDDPACEKAELFAFYGSGAKVTCNGASLSEHHPLPSTGWHVWTVPPSLLKKGVNEFVFSDGGSLLIESSLFPNRSAKSIDGGKSWDFDRLGFDGVENGEYVVRLRLAQYPREGALISAPFESLQSEAPIPPGAKGSGGFYINYHTMVDKPALRQVAIEARSGKTPAPDASWSGWNEQRAMGRFAQWRVRLRTEDVANSPVLERIRYEPKDESQSPTAQPEQPIRVLELSPISIQRSSHPFAYQQPFHRLDLLRKRYKLDEVIAGGKTELDKFVALREWCRFTAPKGWDSGATAWCPPWDALIILETNKTPLALCMCTHYSTLFVQTALALGYNARHVILDHHCVAEVWSNQFRKWILIDTGCSHDPALNCHFEKSGVPLNALEIHNLWRAKRTNEIEVVYTGARGRINGADISKKNQCGFDNFRRFAIPFRNNHLITPFPGELEQGQSEYFCDMYLWWEDHAVPTESPEYGKTSCRPADFYWTLNETAVDLVAAGFTPADRKPTTTSNVTDAAGIQPAATLEVALTTVTPNFDKFVVSIDGGKWEARPAAFAWKLHAGENALRVKSVNKFGVEGVESIARVRSGQ